MALVPGERDPYPRVLRRENGCRYNEFVPTRAVRMLSVAVAIIVLLHPSISLDGQTGNPRPHVELQSAPQVRLPGEADSNSPAVWDRVTGRNFLFVMTSFSGRPSTASGRVLTGLSTPREIVLEPSSAGPRTSTTTRKASMSRTPPRSTIHGSGLRPRRF